MKEEQIALYRNELKYFVTYADYMALKKILSKFLKTDSNSVSGRGYWIRSLYFDTPDNHEYIEKVIGVEIRKKIRLRIYNVDTQKVKLEIKNKFNNYMKKETTSISRVEALKLIQGDKSFLMNPENKILNRVFYLMIEKYYRPVIIVDYYRDAFIGDFNNIRITFDMDISACTTNMNIFSRDLNLYPVFDNSKIVMEVKYNLFLPTWLKRILASKESTNSAISKYCYGRDVCLINS